MGRGNRRTRGGNEQRQDRDDHRGRRPPCEDMLHEFPLWTVGRPMRPESGGRYQRARADVRPAPYQTGR